MATAANVEEYLADVPEPKRAAPEKLRGQIRRAAPGAVETISYQMPAFKLDGRFLVSFAAFRHHCSLFPASDRVMREMGEELAPYFSGKGTMRFTASKPIPATIVKKIVRARIEENAEAAAAAAKRRRAKQRS